MINKISWLGTIASIIGAFVVASKLFLVGYCFFIVGSISWLIVGFARKDKSLMVLNGTFFLANILGFYNSVV
jgi:nicotinamide riboside transporter PnuC